MPKLSNFASWPSATDNPQWLEQRMSRTNGPKDAQAIVVRLNLQLKKWSSQKRSRAQSIAFVEIFLFYHENVCCV